MSFPRIPPFDSRLRGGFLVARLGGAAVVLAASRFNALHKFNARQTLDIGTIDQPAAPIPTIDVDRHACPVNSVKQRALTDAGKLQHFVVSNELLSVFHICSFAARGQMRTSPLTQLYVILNLISILYLCIVMTDGERVSCCAPAPADDMHLDVVNVFTLQVSPPPAQAFQFLDQERPHGDVFRGLNRWALANLLVDGGSSVPNGHAKERPDAWSNLVQGVAFTLELADLANE
jgi:hypothetical protein